MKKDKMSPKQFQAYMKLDYKEWKNPCNLKFSLSTLNALVRKGYAESKETFGVGWFPRSCTFFRKTDKPI